MPFLRNWLLLLVGLVGFVFFMDFMNGLTSRSWRDPQLPPEVVAERAAAHRAELAVRAQERQARRQVCRAVLLPAVQRELAAAGAALAPQRADALYRELTDCLRSSYGLRGLSPEEQRARLYLIRDLQEARGALEAYR